MTIERTNSEVIVRLPLSLNIEEIQEFLDYFKYKEMAQNSKAKQQDADQLAREVNKSWWQQNKDKYLPEE